MRDLLAYEDLDNDPPVSREEMNAATPDKIIKALWDIANAPGWHRPSPGSIALADALAPYTEERASGGLALRDSIEVAFRFARHLAVLHRDRGCARDHKRDYRRSLEAHMLRDCTDIEVNAFRIFFLHAWDVA